MTANLAARAEEYYKRVGEKDPEGIKEFLHSEVEFSSPIKTVKGKETVVEWTGEFMKMLESLTIRSKFEAGNQAVIVYNTDLAGGIKDFPSVSLLDFHEGLIIKIQLFFDASSFSS